MTTSLSGRTGVLLHIGYPTHSFKAPLIYNPWFEAHDIDAAVVPLGLPEPAFSATFRSLMTASNVRGALVTMPHKVTVLDLVDEVRPAARIAGAANAVLVREDGMLVADMFDGEGFVRGMERHGRSATGARALVTGCGGVGSAIAASLAAAGVAELGLYDVRTGSADALAGRLTAHHPQLRVVVGDNDPDGYDVVVNATPMGMEPGDPLPFDVSRIAPTAFVGEVVMKQQITPFLAAARQRGCATQVGTDMLFEQIPAYLEFFGYGSATPAELREVARLAA
ncbi:shikimate dehydrogenase family protein [Raineyella fluvialis]|uniref:Shikimate dehydrogenase n=1 Tax=Raineyella fluvialis TaxID=2662261 RepID=A0A5Q2F7Z1_9ACTN|nr:shikimate dehydrogenase [Raineyella fluvialis]QGF22949.1 shikimate dehydrogenase [Raineyella fluvialis]